MNTTGHVIMKAYNFIFPPSKLRKFILQFLFVFLHIFLKHDINSWKKNLHFLIISEANAGKSL